MTESSAQQSLALQFNKRELRVEFWDPAPDNFLGCSCNIYGGSGTGKTVFLREILCRLQHKIERFYVFSGTAGISRDSFFTDKVVPSPFLHNSLDMETIKRILDYQELLIQVENQSTNVNFVVGLAEKMPSTPLWDMRLSEFRRLQERFNQVSRTCPDDSPELLEWKSKFCLDVLSAVAVALENQGRNTLLTEGELLVVKRRGKVAQGICIIVDDLADAVAQLKGKDLEQLTKMYIKGRHYRLTFFMVLQDITFLKAALRSNGMINCFTCSNSARKFIFNASSGIDRPSSHLALAISARVFENSDQLHHVLIFLKSERDQFRFSKARPPSEMPMIRLGAERYWLMAQEIEKRRSSRIQISSDNSFRNRI